MSGNEGFILKAEQFNQEEWREMFRRVSETCKDLRNENECLQNQLQQKEKIIKDVREYIKENTGSYYTNVEETNEEFELICDPEELLEILDKEVIKNE